MRSRQQPGIEPAQVDDHAGGIVPDHVQERSVKPEPGHVRQSRLSRPQVQGHVRERAVQGQVVGLSPTAAAAFGQHLHAAHPLRRRRIRFHVVPGADHVLAARAERVHLKHVGQVQVVQAVDAPQIGLLVAEHVPEAHFLQGGRGVEHGPVREPGHLQLQPGPRQQAAQYPGPAAPPVRRLDQPLFEPGQAVARRHLALLTGQHEYGGHGRIRVQAHRGRVQSGLVTGQEPAAPNRGRHRHQAPLSGRRPHHEVHLAVPSLGRRTLAARLKHEKKTLKRNEDTTQLLQITIGNMTNNDNTAYLC